MFAKSILTLATAAWCLAAPVVSAEPQLVMVSQPGCAYCEAWERTIGPIYPKTPEGAFAPLVHADKRSGPPDGITYSRKVNFTPTFILVDDGAELDRIEGYPGEDFFWGLLGMMLEKHTDFSKGDS